MPSLPASVPGSTPIRGGLWFLPAAGILLALAFTVAMTIPDPDVDFDRFAAATLGPVSVISGSVYVAALIGLLLGLVALYGWLGATPGWRWALAGLVSSVVSIGLLLAGFGAAVLGSEVVAQVYLAGHKGARDVVAPLSGGTFSRYILVYFIAAMVLGVLGAVANGVAIWRLGTLPRWTAIVFGLGFALTAASFPIATQLGGVLLAVAGGWLAARVWRGGLPV